MIFFLNLSTPGGAKALSPLGENWRKLTITGDNGQKSVGMGLDSAPQAIQRAKFTGQVIGSLVAWSTIRRALFHSISFDCDKLRKVFGMPKNFSQFIVKFSPNYASFFRQFSPSGDKALVNTHFTHVTHVKFGGSPFLGLRYSEIFENFRKLLQLYLLIFRLSLVLWPSLWS